MAPGLSRPVPAGSRTETVEKPAQFHERHLPHIERCGCYPREVYRKHVANVVDEKGAFLWEKIMEYRLCLN